jgi:hypothetical protein
MSRRVIPIQIDKWSYKFTLPVEDLIGGTFIDHGTRYVVVEVRDYKWRGKRRKCIAVPESSVATTTK